MPDHAAGPPLRRALSANDGTSSADQRSSVAPASSTILVVGGGDPPTKLDVARWPLADSVIAADAGVDHARRWNRGVDMVVGDLDSASPGALRWAADGGARIERHRTDKDETDLELAMDAAMALGPERIVVSGISGGRLDHLVANLALVCSPRYRSTIVDVVSGDDRAFVVWGERCLAAEPGQLVTLVAMLGDVDGVTTVGLQFPLTDDRLLAGSPRGVSNRALADSLVVSTTSGVVLVIMPAPEAVES